MARKIYVAQLHIEGIPVEVSLKRMKHIRLKVCPPNGEVKVSAPHHVSMNDIERMVQEKKSWITQQRALLLAQPAPVIQQFGEGEMHWVFGEQWRLKLTGTAPNSGVEYNAEERVLCLHQGLSIEQREAALNNWYRQRLVQEIPQFIHKWQPVVGKSAKEWRIRKMKTRWGSCNIQRQRIWLNLELAKKPLSCLEYVVVHELTHFHERNHNQRFYGLMDSYLPNWRETRRLLNQ